MFTRSSAMPRASRLHIALSLAMTTTAMPVMAAPPASPGADWRLTMETFLFFTIVWLIAWGIFLLSALTQHDGRRVRAHTLLDDIEISP